MGSQKKLNKCTIIITRNLRRCKRVKNLRVIVGKVKRKRKRKKKTGKIKKKKRTRKVEKETEQKPKIKTMGQKMNKKGRKMRKQTLKIIVKIRRRLMMTIMTMMKQHQARMKESKLIQKKERNLNLLKKGKVEVWRKNKNRIRTKMQWIRNRVRNQIANRHSQSSKTQRQYSRTIIRLMQKQIRKRMSRQIPVLIKILTRLLRLKSPQKIRLTIKQMSLRRPNLNTQQNLKKNKMKTMGTKMCNKKKLKSLKVKTLKKLLNNQVQNPIIQLAVSIRLHLANSCQSCLY